MINALSMEEYFQEVINNENRYLEQFDFMPLCGSDYEELRILFDDYDLNSVKFNEQCNSYSFIHFGYIPF